MKKLFPLLATAVVILIATAASAQSTSQIPPQEPPITTRFTGTLRTKFEYQPSEDNARFSVRTARFGVGGEVYSHLSYKMEIDLSDEGRIKMVDAYVGARLYKSLSFSIGYMRVPFTVDAHRSPHLQLFANRSFIAKQVGNVRDVGASFQWRPDTKIPVNLQLGVFNGSGLPEDLAQYWTRHFNYSAKLQLGLARNLNFQTSYQTTRPAHVRIHLYDVAITFRPGRWLFEGEYLHKNYGDAFPSVDAFDAFFSYGLPIGGDAIRTVSFLGRYDYMDNHSNGLPATSGLLVTNDIRRHRATAGVTFSLGLPFSADVRLNFEKYFYPSSGIPSSLDSQIGPSDHDKLVLELMVHF